jgi:hypothetical protein
MAISGSIQSLVGYLLAMLCFGFDHKTVSEFLGEMMTPPPAPKVELSYEDDSGQAAKSPAGSDNIDSQGADETGDEAADFVDQVHAEHVSQQPELRESDPLLNKTAIATGKRLARRHEMSQDPRYWILILLFSFLGAGVNEEVIKYLAIKLYPYPLGPGKSEAISTQDVLLVAVAAGMGFATTENVVLMVATARGSAKEKRTGGGEAREAGISSLTVLERFLSSIPGHTALSVLIAANLVAMRTSNDAVVAGVAGMWRAIWQSVLFHGAFDFALLAISAWEGNVGWLHPKECGAIWAAVATVVGLQGSLYVVLFEKLRQIGLR